jgi:hypothetical protein
MRSMISAAAFLVGAFTMADTVAQEKEELKEGDRVYNEKVTVRVWDVRKSGGPGFLNPVPNQWALRKETKDGLMFDVRGGTSNTTPEKGSEITDAAGNVYTVVRAESPPTGLFVKLTKAAPKKP